MLLVEDVNFDLMLLVEDEILIFYLMLLVEDVILI